MPSKTSAWKHWTDLKYLLVLACLIGFAFLPCLQAQFVYWDDDLHVLNNPLVTRMDAGSMASIVQTTVNKTYIPLTILTFNLEHRLFGFNPFVFHLDNLILHILTCLLIYTFARRLEFEPLAAFLAALLFGIHPMHVESVAWITERKDVLYSLFYVLGLIQYCRYVQSNDKKFLGWCIGAGFLSLFAKPMALSFPLALFLLDWFFKRRLTLSIFLEKIPFLLFIPIVWITYSLNILPNTSPPLESCLIWIWSFSFYLIKFFVPVGLTPLYTLSYPVSVGNPSYIIAILAACAFLLTVIKFRQNRWITFAALYYFLSIFFLLRMSDVAKNLGPSIVADRFMYLPSLGICLWLAWLLNSRLKEKLNNKKFILRAITVAVLCLVVATSNQCRIWINDLTLWNYVISKDQTIALAYNSRGAALSKRGEQNRALEDINQAIRLNPRYAMAYYNRGKIYAKLGDASRALEDLSAALAINPRHGKSYFERGIIQSKLNNWQEALADLNSAIALDPTDAGAYNNRGIVHKKMKLWDEALKDYNEAVRLNPRSVQAYVNRSSVWKELKRYDQSLQDIQKAAALGYPADPQYLQELQTLRSANP